MNGSSQLPQYTFDPATQQYRLKTPAEQAREQQKGKSGLGSLYEATGGGNPAAPSGPVGFGMMAPGMAEMGVGFQNVGNALSGIPGITTAIGGALASGIGNSMMGSQVSPVANPTPATVTAIAPDPAFSGLAAMNAQMATEQAESANQASVANTAAAVSEAVASDPAAVGAAAEAAGVSDAGGSAMGDSGAGIGDVGGGGGSTATGGSDSSTTGSGASDTGAATGGWRGGGQIMNYKAGGLASAAQHVQDQGRKGDSMLVHMSPDEVRGLQAIAMQHGGSLTVNPKTGLVEANFLKSILPVIAGAALAPFTGGASMAALLVGGGTALMTGSLEKGLMAGLGAFGGASLAGSLSAAGAAATAPAATGTTAGLGAQGAAGAQAAAASGGASAVPGAVQTGGAKFLQAAGTQMAPQGAATLIPGTSQAALQAAASGGAAAPVTYGNMGTGLSQIIQGNPSARDVFMQDIGGVKGLATKVGPAVAGSMFSAEEPDEGGGKPQEYIRPYSFDFKPSADTEPGFKYRTGAPGESTAEQRYLTPTFTPMGVFKAGTEPGPSFYGTPTQEQLALYSKPKDSPLGLAAGGIAGLGKGGLKDGAFIVPADVVSHLGNGSNDAGQKLLARGLGARPIKGKGDGMSDSIPTSIEGRQPARVADGEAYIPPEVVKKVGSKRLYNMMAKIRQARTGTKRQAPEVNPRKFMPA